MKTLISQVSGILLSPFLLIAVANSCDPEPPDKNVPVGFVPKQQVEGARFTVERCGAFNINAGYADNKREILIITDTSTKRHYLGVTGVGVTELHEESNGHNQTTTKEE